MLLLLANKRCVLSSRLTYLLLDALTGLFFSKSPVYDIKKKKKKYGKNKPVACFKMCKIAPHGYSLIISVKVSIVPGDSDFALN